jgi:leucyl/phenylalanyl-tRNA---protein transferase
MLTPDQVLYGYSIGVFPMANPDEANAIHWYEPELRGIIPLDALKISKSLRQTIRSGKYHLGLNQNFEAVMRACAQRDKTWISEDIIRVYVQLHQMGYAHSVEARNDSGELVGGLYGIALGRAFFGESMFHTARDASKVALVYLVEQLREHQFTLLDTQYLTPHLQSLGGIEITQSDYLELLKSALMKNPAHD